MHENVQEFVERLKLESESAYSESSEESQVAGEAMGENSSSMNIKQNDLLRKNFLYSFLLCAVLIFASVIFLLIFFIYADSENSLISAKAVFLFHDQNE